MDDRLLAHVDGLVAGGVFASRSEAVRVALEQLVDAHRRREIGDSIVAGYRRHPQTEDELAGMEAATRAMIDEEPWCR